MPTADDATRTPDAGGATQVDVPMLVQAAYYLLTGPWPLVHLRSFEAITGPKPDRFVVESAGALFTASGSALAVGALRGGRDLASRVLSALVPALSTFVVLRHRRSLRLVYLADAAAECGLAMWAAASWRTRRRSAAEGVGNDRRGGLGTAGPAYLLPPHPGS